MKKPDRKSMEGHFKSIVIYGPHVGEPVAKRTRSAQRPMWEKPYESLPKKQELVEFHDAVCSNGKLVKSGAKETILEMSVRRARNYEKELELSIMESVIKQIDDKYHQWIKTHNKQKGGLDDETRSCIEKMLVAEVKKQIMGDEIRSSIQQLVKEEMKKQIMELIELKEGEEWEQLFHKTAKTKVDCQKSKSEETKTSEVGGKKRPLPISDTEEKELVVDLCIDKEEKFGHLVSEIIGGKEKNGTEYERLERRETVKKRCTAKIGENQQSDNNSLNLEKVIDGKKGNNAKETLKKQKSSTMSVSAIEEIDAPFQDLLLDADGQPKETTKHEDLDDMWKAMDLVLKGEDDTGMAENKNLKNGRHVKNKGREKRSHHTRLRVAKHVKDGGRGENSNHTTLRIANCKKPSMDSNVSTKMKMSIDGENDITGNLKLKKCSREGISVVKEAKSPFMRLLCAIEKEAQIPPKLEDVFQNQGTSQESKELEDMWKDMELSLKGSTLYSGNMVSIANCKKPSMDSNVSTKMKKSIDGENDINGNLKLKKCIREGISVVKEAKSPFMRLLCDIEKEAQIPPKIEDVFQNQGTSQESKELEDMWKDMELSLKGSTLNSGNMMTSRNVEDFFEAEMGMHDMYCRGEHVFVLDEEIGIICKVCKFVKQEIKNVLPPMILDTGRRQSRKDYGYGEDVSYSPDLDFKDGNEYSSSEFLCPTKHSVWNLIPELKQNMFAHQQEAFEFLWRNIGGGLSPENMKLPTSDDVGGCIISHAPGTGKTFLIISFLRTYLELFPRSRPLIVAPKSMLFTWEAEFRKWRSDIPVYILNRSKTFWNEIASNHEHAEIITLAKSNQLNGKKGKNLWRMVMLREWHRRRSVLAVSYNLFVYLTCEGKESLPSEAKHVGKLLLESPGLLILDEGHQARNSQSKVWNALKKVNTKLRIILSGTLFQNNFRELFNTLYLVRPTFVDFCLCQNSKQTSTTSNAIVDSKVQRTINEGNENRLRKFFMDEIGNKIQNGKEEFEETLEKFRFMTKNFVHCYDGKILNNLPGVRDFAVILRPSPMQQTVLDRIKEANNHDRASNFEFETMVSCVSIHPSLYRDFGIKRLCSGIDGHTLEAIRNDPCQGVKTKFVLDLVQLSKVLEEKVLLFSQNIPPLVYLVENFETHFSWRKGKEIFQLDGTLPLDERQAVIDQFNDPKGEARVLCASIRTCSEGISLTGASRVVFIDLVWNPAIVKQALSRAFRLGQKKHVYVYRLIAWGTMEEEKYQRAVWKDCLSTLVFASSDDEEDIDICKSIHTIGFEDKILDKLVELDKEAKSFHTIFEHCELTGKKEPRSECFQEYHNSNDKAPGLEFC